MTELVDWFDPHNQEHLKAWKHLTQEGVWPEGFIPEGMSINPYWIIQITAKLADCWLNEKLP
jgi:hypothetical protein